MVVSYYLDFYNWIIQLFVHFITQGEGPHVVSKPCSHWQQSENSEYFVDLGPEMKLSAYKILVGCWTTSQLIINWKETV